MKRNEEARARPICGCGNCGDAIDAAFRVVAAEKDCFQWHQTVDNLATQLRGNLKARLLAHSLGIEANRPEIELGLNLAMQSLDNQVKQIFMENGEEIGSLCNVLFEKAIQPGKNQ